MFLRPEFSVLHSAESDYGSGGAYAWLMDVNFVLRGALTLAVVAALRPWVVRRAGLVLLCVWAACSASLAFFPDDLAGTAETSAGRVHVALAAIAFVAVAVGARVTTRSLRASPAWQPVAGALTLLSWGAIVPAVLLGRTHLRAHSLGGLYEKLFLALELLWLAAAAAWAARLDAGETHTIGAWPTTRTSPTGSASSS